MKLERKHRRERSIFRTILVPMMVLLLVETALLLVVPVVGGVFAEMDRNKEEILEQQVKSRRSYLESYMTNNWADLSRVSTEINGAMQSILVENGQTPEEILSSEEAMEDLLMSISEEVISELYLKRASGIYVMFNTQDLRPARIQGKLPDCPGLYIRDMNPETAPSARHGDLSIVRGPRSVAYEQNLKIDQEWKPLYTFGAAENPANYDFIYQPFQAAYETNAVKHQQDFGYWAPGTSVWYDGMEHFVTYSQPLVLGDGTVYGVLGIELLDRDMMSMLPHSDLYLEQSGTYVLAKVHRKWTTLYMENVLVNGRNLERDLLTSDLPLEPRTGKKNAYSCKLGEKDYYVSVEDLNVYGENSPYARQEWMLLGFAAEEDLYELSSRTKSMLSLAVMVMLLSGLFGSLLISKQFSDPIQRMADEVSRAGTKQEDIPQLPATYIQEIDSFADAITDLSREVVHASTRFLRIIEMAAGEISGFEVREGEHAFLTDNFFTMLGMEVDGSQPMTKERFMELMEQVQADRLHAVQQDGSYVYRIEKTPENIRYIRVSVTKMDGTVTGIAEDVTPQIMEKKRIEHDRDYDLLTKQLNRRAFFREVDRVLDSEDGKRCGALIMMDLDDLKKINDNFGHDWGDQYIQQAVKGFVEAAPEQSLLARLGGDEFVLFIYGYESEERLQKEVALFDSMIHSNQFATPEGGKRPVRVSCGVALYPRDSGDFRELMKYADFAMYQIKRTVKDSMGSFNLEVFRQQTCLAQQKRELKDVLSEQRVDYHFQPIFNAGDGSVYAYEALMRPCSELLKNPETVLELAKEEGSLAEVERITMLRSSQCYADLVRQGKVSEKAYLFVNSLADQLISQEDQQLIQERCGSLLPRMVVEITESSDLNPEILEKKRKMQCFSGLFALDDYGSGYNGEKNLLELAPKYVKLDISIVQGIDTDMSKQHMMTNLLSYAHQRNMLVVAEGVETQGELRTCLELGADLLQGFALARPAAVPPAMEPAAMNLIRYFQQEHSN